MQSVDSQWLLYVDNAQAVSSLYDQEPPLAAAMLHRVSLSESGWVFKFTLAIPILPPKLPNRWERNANTVQIEFGLASFRDLKILKADAWPSNNVVDLQCTPVGDGVHVKIRGQMIDIEFATERLHVCGIVGLRTEGLWGQ